MGKTILELFYKTNLSELNPQEGITVATGKTAADKYDIRNSKDKVGYPASPLMRLPFFALQKIRLAAGERKQETFFEQELSGIRTLRGLSSLLLYGSETLRLKLQSTPSVEAMKNANAEETFNAKGDRAVENKSALSNFGQKLQETRQEVNKFLGLPKPLYPTAIKDSLEVLRLVDSTEGSTNAPYDVMIRLGEIKNDAKGSVLGKILKNTAGGTPQQIAKQGIGQAAIEVRKKLRKSIFGRNALTSQIIVETELEYPYSQENPYSKKPPSSDSSGYANKNFISELENNYNIFYAKPDNFPFQQKKGYQYENGIGVGSFGSSTGSFDSFRQRFLPTIPYTQNNTSPSDKWNVANPKLEEDDPKAVQLKKDNIELVKGKTIDVNTLRPPKLANVKGKGDLQNVAYSKAGGSTIYGDNNDTLEVRRGLGTQRDIINQTGRFTKSELEEIQYLGRKIEDVDLIPMKIQRINDMSAIILRTVITGFSETFTPGWEGSQFLGNPFKFYSYTGVDRKVSLTLKFYAMSQVELVMMWRRLEYLAHLTYPYGYTEVGTIPTMFYFTLGTMYVNKPAILTSLTYNIDDNQQLWETGGPGKVRIRRGVEDTTAPEQIRNYNIDFGGRFYEMYKFGDESPLAIKNLDQKSTNTIGKQYLMDETNINIDEYKLPKFVNAQMELTFLESSTQTYNNVYSYGKPVDTFSRASSDNTGGKASRANSQESPDDAVLKEAKARNNAVIASNKAKRDMDIKTELSKAQKAGNSKRVAQIKEGKSEFGAYKLG